MPQKVTKRPPNPKVHITGPKLQKVEKYNKKLPMIAVVDNFNKTHDQ